MAVFDVGLRVSIRKILLIVHIRSMNKRGHCKKMYLEQIQKGWPGFAAETKSICKNLDLEDCNITIQSKDQYKILHIRACYRSNEKYLHSLPKGKCKRNKYEEYGWKDYILKKAIINEFQTRFGLLPFAGNYSHNQIFAKSNFL